LLQSKQAARVLGQADKTPFQNQKKEFNQNSSSEIKKKSALKEGTGSKGG